MRMNSFARTVILPMISFIALSLLFINSTISQCPVLENPGFDSGDNGWLNDELGDDPGSTSNWLAGGNAASLGAGDIIYQEVTVVPFTNYVLNYYYTIDDDNFPPDNFEVLVLGGGGYGTAMPIATGTVLGSYDGLLVSGKKNYFAASIKFNSGSNTTVSIYGEHNGFGDTVRLDEFEILCPAPANCECDETDLPFIQCSSFEDGCRPWGGGDGNEFWENDAFLLSGGLSQFSGTSTANTGSQAANLTDDPRYAYQEVHVEPNACYTVEYYTRINTGGVVRLDILPDGNHIDPTLITPLATGLHNVSTGGAYVRETLTFTVTTECVVALFFWSPGATDDARIDDVTFISKECKPDIIPPIAVCGDTEIIITVDPVTGIGTLAMDALAAGMSMDVLPDTVAVVETSPQVDFTVADVGIQMVTLTATDACGNEGTVDCPVTVIFNDQCEQAFDGLIDVCQFIEDNPGSILEDLDCDEGGTTNAVECALGRNPIDPCDDVNITITSQPASQYTCLGGDIIFSASAMIDDPELATTPVFPLVFELQMSQGGTWITIDSNSDDVDGVESVDFLVPSGTAMDECSAFRIAVQGIEGCDVISDVVFLFEIEESPYTLACNDQINLSLNDECGVDLFAEIFLEGEPTDICGASGLDFYAAFYTVSLFADGTEIDPADAGNFINTPLTYSISDACSGASCWGNVLFEDKQGPVAFECEDVTVNCIDYANDDLPTEPIVFGPDEVMNSMGFPAGGLDLLAGSTIMFDLSTMIPAGAEVVDVDVIIDLEDTGGIGDTDDADLILTSPDGTIATLFEGFAFWAGACFNVNTIMNFILDDEAPQWMNCADLTGGGSFSMDPAEGFDMLSTFDGGAASGIWMVTMTNVFTSDEYLVNNIELVITYRSPILDLNELDNCGDVTITSEDTIIPGGDCGETLINRTYVATDAQGNTSTCSSTITVEPINLVDDLGTILLLPPDLVELPCGTGTDPEDIAAFFDDPTTEDCPNSDDDCPMDIIENNEGISTAYPHYIAWGCNSSCSTKDTDHFQPIDNNVCSIYATYSDQVIDACGEGCSGSVKIIRTWTLIDWCTSEQIPYVQIIKSVDDEAPVVTAPDQSYSVSPWGCVASGQLPAPDHLFDACGSDVTYSVAGPAGVTITSLNGDGEAPYVFVGAPKGEHTFTYYAEDCCGNVGETTMTASVVDDTPPTAIALQNIVVSLTSGGFDEGGIAKLFAKDVDNGSHDGDCGPVRLEVARADGFSCSSSIREESDIIESRVGDCDLGGPILEGDFELGDGNNDPAGDSRDPWRNSDLGGVIQITSSSFTGDWALKLPSDGSRIGYQEILVAPNTDYTVDFFYFMDNANSGTVSVEVLAGGGYDNTQPVSSGTVLGSFTDGSATSYTPGIVSFNSGANTIVSIYISNEGEEAQIDDIGLNCGGSGPCALGSPVEEGGLELGDANNDPAGDSRDAWRNSDLGGVIQITSAALLGDWAMKLPADGSRIGYQELSVSQNTDFTLDFFYFMDNAGTGSVTVQILAGGGYGSANPVASGTVLGSFSDGSETSYAPASIAFNSGSNSIVSIFIFNEGEEAQLDEITLNCDTGSGGGGGGGTVVGNEFVKFCCDDIDGSLSYETPDGQTVFYNEYDVILKVWDDGNCDGVAGNAGDNFNETWATVRVENKLPPVIVCPPDATVTCTMDLLIHNEALAPTEAELGMLLAPDFGTGIATGAGVCGAISVTYEDDVDEDICYDDYTIEREWCITGTDICCEQEITVEKVGEFDDATISWNSGFPEEEIEQDCLDDDPLQEPTWLEAPCDLIGWSVETDTFYIEGNEAQFGCIKIINDYTVIDWCADEEFTFRQTIKVIDNVAPVLEVPELCVEVGADCTAEVELCATATDMGDCESPWLKWEVLVDINGDWTYDYEFSSYVSPSDPNFGTGINELYIAPTAVNDELCIDLPEIIAGSKNVHRALWKVSDGCGNFTSVTREFLVTDKKAPTPYCYSVSSAVMTNGEVELWACDFVLSSEDNCSSEFTYTFNGPDEGFETPESTPGWIEETGCEGQVFTCPDNGNVTMLKVYTWDECNNSEVCFVELTLSGCEEEGDDNGRIAGDVGTEFSEMVSDVNIQITSNQPEYPMTIMTDVNGEYSSTNHTFTQDYSVTALKNDDHRNGVSTLDILLIQRHILNLTPLTSPYQYISADANNDQVISAADLVDIRKLVLEIVDEFPSNNSWRFADAAQALTTSNAFAFNEVIDILALSADMDNESFVANKIGDVNGSVVLSATGSTTEVRNGKNLNMNFTGVTTAEGVSVEVTSANFNDIVGYQFTMNTNGLELLSVEAGAIDMTDDNVAVLDRNTLTMSWNTVSAVSVSNEVLFTLNFAGSDLTAVEDMAITSDATSAEAYDSDLTVLNVELGTEASSEFALGQNEPNPFTTQTVIEFTLPTAGTATLTVMDVTGRVISQKEGTYAKGLNSVTLTKDDLATSGVLYYQLESGEFSAAKKMILVD